MPPSLPAGWLSPETESLEGTPSCNGRAAQQMPPINIEQTATQHPSAPRLAGGPQRAVYGGVSMCAEVLLPRGGPSAYDRQAGGMLRQRVCSVDLRARRRSLVTCTHTHASTMTIVNMLI